MCMELIKFTKIFWVTLTLVLAISTIYWSPFIHSITSKPSLSITLAWELPDTTSIMSPVLLYCNDLIWWLCKKKKKILVSHRVCLYFHSLSTVRKKKSFNYTNWQFIKSGASTSKGPSPPVAILLSSPPTLHSNLLKTSLLTLNLQPKQLPSPVLDSSWFVPEDTYKDCLVCSHYCYKCICFWTLLLLLLFDYNDENEPLPAQGISTTYILDPTPSSLLGNLWLTSPSSPSQLSYLNKFSSPPLFL